MLLTIPLVLHCVESLYSSNHPKAASSVNWNHIECMAHVLNLAAQQVLKSFIQPIERDFSSGIDLVTADRCGETVESTQFYCTYR